MFVYMLFFNKYKIVSVDKLLWYKRSKTFWDMLLWNIINFGVVAVNISLFLHHNISSLIIFL